MANEPDPLQQVTKSLGKAVGSFQKWAKTMDVQASSERTAAPAPAPPPPRREVLAPPRREVLAPPPPRRLGQAPVSEAVAPAPAQGGVTPWIDAPSPPVAEPIMTPAPEQALAVQDAPLPPREPVDPSPAVSAPPASVPPQSVPAAGPARPTVTKRPVPARQPRAVESNAGPEAREVDDLRTKLVTSPGGFVLPPPPRSVDLPDLPSWVALPPGDLGQ